MVDTVVFGMCTRNEEDVVRKTIRAVRNQTHPPDHVYVCDDSDDSTPDIVRDELEGSGIPFEVFHQERYDGHGGARQELYERARSVDPDVICMLDANNTIGDDWLESILRFRAENPEYDVLTGPECDTGIHREAPSPHDPLYYRHAAIAFDADLLETVGGWDPDFGRGEDWDLALRMYRAGSKVFTSTQWCSRYVAPDPPDLTRKRIARNPTSVPYLAKYGAWYLTFHPAQVLKDLWSVCFYALFLLGLAAIPVGVGFGLLATAVVVGCGFVLAQRRYEGDSDQPANRLERPLYMLLFTAPAVARSCRNVADGRYRT
ncbi:glycosyltransferase [Halarchaeum salinum]|uniref:Glycosyltransferase 2-like domain-containing protein n=1 Tax=Halarchaeum salinum TaxID=489912 RepID=A0AAV3S696_9EURY